MWEMTIEYVDGKTVKYEDAHLEVHDSGAIIKLTVDGSDILIPVLRIDRIIIKEMK